MESDCSPECTPRKIKSANGFTVKSIWNFTSIDDLPDLKFSDKVEN